MPASAAASACGDARRAFDQQRQRQQRRHREQAGPDHVGQHVHPAAAAATMLPPAQRQRRGSTSAKPERRGARRRCAARSARCPPAASASASHWKPRTPLAGQRHGQADGEEDLRLHHQRGQPGRDVGRPWPGTAARTGPRRSARRRPPACRHGTAGRADEQRRRQQREAQSAAPPAAAAAGAQRDLMTTKLVPHTATTASASASVRRAESARRPAAVTPPPPRGRRPAPWPRRARGRRAPASAPPLSPAWCSARPADSVTRQRRAGLVHGAQRRQRSVQALEPAARQRRVGVGHHQHEAAAAPARQHVGHAHVAQRFLRQRPQHGVAAGIAVRLVDRLEAVDVEQRQAEGLARADAALVLLLHQRLMWRRLTRPVSSSRVVCSRSRASACASSAALQPRAVAQPRQPPGQHRHRRHHGRHQQEVAQFDRRRIALPVDGRP